MATERGERKVACAGGEWAVWVVLWLVFMVALGKRLPCAGLERSELGLPASSPINPAQHFCAGGTASFSTELISGTPNIPDFAHRTRVTRAALPRRNSAYITHTSKSKSKSPSPGLPRTYPTSYTAPSISGGQWERTPSRAMF